MENTSISKALLAIGVEVGKPIIPIANYVQTKTIGCSLFVSGQLPIKDGEVVFRGIVGKDLTVEKAKEAAELCVINVINQLILTLDDNLAKIKSCIKLEIFIATEGSFERHAEIANGASDFLIKVLGEKGKHTRMAIGVSSLPLNSAVEVAAIFEISSPDKE